MTAFRLYKGLDTIYLESEGNWKQTTNYNWTGLINRPDLHSFLITELDSWSDAPGVSNYQAPILDQEVWAAGVTYLRSKEARMDEAKSSGGDVFYDKVYDADRPEIFFKSTANRVAGDHQPVYIRRDSSWNVPEPELALFINSLGEIQGYTIGNDMSSRSIEGENPLYLPQAKTYDRSAGLGPCLYIPDHPIASTTEIRVRIERKGVIVYQDSTHISQMKRTHEELVNYLFRECTFPQGVFLMTGTCLVPGDDFTLQPNDTVEIDIDNIGSLTNTVSYNEHKA